jgi:hypothetical protein
MRRVRLHLAEGIVLHVADLSGSMVGRHAGLPPVLDDAQSYVLHVDAAHMSLDMPSLMNLLNQRVFAHESAPLRDVFVVVARDGRLALKGKLRKGVSVPFSSKATVTASSAGMLRLHVESFKAIGVPVKGLMDLLGLELEDVMDLEKRRGISVADDDLVVSPGGALPPPEIRGRLARAVTTGQRIELTFTASGERAETFEPPVRGARNYIYFGGGAIRFGKLTMEDADLQLIDADPRDPFDFFPARYQRQLVAGYSKNTRVGGLRTFLPDYDDLVRRQDRSPAANRPEKPAAPRPSP